VKRDASLKLAGEVRDLQVVDRNGARCGIADEIEFEARNGTLEVKAILVGPLAFRGRLPRWIQTLVTLLAGDRVTRVPWDAVLRITSDITLEDSAEAYGLRVVERRLERWLSRIPLAMQ
jgi:sporulation protein YlmC with PRC-barrel domain